MRSLSYDKIVPVGALPDATVGFTGVTVMLTTDNQPYYCDGYTWKKLTATSGGGGAAQNVFVQPIVPTPQTPTYVWFQTGLGSDGTGITLWIEDGTT